MRVLITGATGFVGEHLVRRLCSEDRRTPLDRFTEIRGLVRDPRKARRLPPQARLFYGDLTDINSILPALAGVDIIIHLGAAVHGPWERHRIITVDGTRLLLEAAADAGTRTFIYVSSLAVYDRLAVGRDALITEHSPRWKTLDAAGPYAWGKIEAERIVAQVARRTGMKYIIARPGLIYGPQHTIFEHLGLRFSKSTFLPLGGSSVRLPLVHIDSVTDALARLAVEPAASGRTFNIVDDEQVSKREYLRALSTVNGRRYRCIGLTAAPLTMAARAAQHLHKRGRASWLPRISPQKIRARTTEHAYDSTALRETTGWRPAYPLVEGLRRATIADARQRCPIGIRRVGLIGAGRIAEFHIQALRQIPGIEISGIFDLDPDAAQSMARRFEIPLATSDREQFYRQARPQSVHIMTPPHTHAEIALDAMRRGAHILMEKPLALTLAECNELRQAAHENCVTIGVDHNFTTDPRIRRARRMIERGAIGDLVHIEIFWAFDLRRFQHMLPGDDGQETWAMQLPGGPLEDLAPHPLSIALALINETVRPESSRTFRSGRLRYPFDDELRLLLAGNRATASVNMSLSASPDDLTVAIYGTRSTLRLDLQNLLMIEARQGPGPKAIARGLRTLSGGAATILQTVQNAGALALKRAEPPASPITLIRDHYAALASGAELPCDFEQGRAVVDIIRSIWPGLNETPVCDDLVIPFSRCTSLSAEPVRPWTEV